MARKHRAVTSKGVISRGDDTPVTHAFFEPRELIGMNPHDHIGDHLASAYSLFAKEVEQTYLSNSRRIARILTRRLNSIGIDANIDFTDISDPIQFHTLDLEKLQRDPDLASDFLIGILDSIEGLFDYNFLHDKYYSTGDVQSLLNTHEDSPLVEGITAFSNLDSPGTFNAVDLIKRKLSERAIYFNNSLNALFREVFGDPSFTIGLSESDNSNVLYDLNGLDTSPISEEATELITPKMTEEDPSLIGKSYTIWMGGLNESDAPHYYTVDSDNGLTVLSSIDPENQSLKSIFHYRIVHRGNPKTIEDEARSKSEILEFVDNFIDTFLLDFNDENYVDEDIIWENYVAPDLSSELKSRGINPELIDLALARAHTVFTHNFSHPLSPSDPIISATASEKPTTVGNFLSWVEAEAFETFANNYRAEHNEEPPTNVVLKWLSNYRGVKEPTIGALDFVIKEKKLKEQKLIKKKLASPNTLMATRKKQNKLNKLPRSKILSEYSIRNKDKSHEDKLAQFLKLVNENQDIVADESSLSSILDEAEDAGGLEIGRPPQFNVFEPITFGTLNSKHKRSDTNVE